MRTKINLKMIQKKLTNFHFLVNFPYRTRDEDGPKYLFQCKFGHAKKVWQEGKQSDFINLS